jgi:raffinose/stachyose/melibiose transport system permease protein
VTDAVVKAETGRAKSPARLRSARLSRGRQQSPKQQRVGLLYVLPALLLFAAVVIVPFAHGVWISLHAWDGVSAPRWVGLHNYTAAFTDPVVRQAFFHSLVIIVFYSAIPVAIGLILTGVLARKPLRGAGIWRALLFLPQVISVVVVGVAWQWIFAQDGPINVVLRAVGLGSFTRVWLGDYTWALPAEGAIGTWLMSGLCMVLFLAGAQTIDHDLYDAASVDGAGPIREFFVVTLPGLRNVLAVASILTLVGALNNFGLIWVTTQGGPGRETQVTSTLIYTRAFVLNELGDASALAVLLGIGILAISIGISRVADRS